MPKFIDTASKVSSSKGRLWASPMRNSKPGWTARAFLTMLAEKSSPITEQPLAVASSAT